MASATTSRRKRTSLRSTSARYVSTPTRNGCRGSTFTTRTGSRRANCPGLWTLQTFYLTIYSTITRFIIILSCVSWNDLVYATSKIKRKIGAYSCSQFLVITFYANFFVSLLRFLILFYLLFTILFSVLLYKDFQLNSCWTLRSVHYTVIKLLPNPA